MEETYKKYFERNTSKFFYKWKFTDQDLGKMFIKDGEEFELIGQVSEALFFFRKINDDSRWFVHGDLIKEQFSIKTP